MANDKRLQELERAAAGLEGDRSRLAAKIAGLEKAAGAIGDVAAAVKAGRELADARSDLEITQRLLNRAVTDRDALRSAAGAAAAEEKQRALRAREAELNKRFVELFVPFRQAVQACAAIEKELAAADEVPHSVILTDLFVSVERQYPYLASREPELLGMPALPSLEERQRQERKAECEARIVQLTESLATQRAARKDSDYYDEFSKRIKETEQGIDSWRANLAALG